MTIGMAAALGGITLGIGAGAGLAHRHRSGAKKEKLLAALFSAIEKKKVRAVAEVFEVEKSLLDEMRKRTEFDSAAQSPVHCAVRADAVAVLNFLLGRGFSANSAILTGPTRRRTWSQFVRLQLPEVAEREPALLFAVRTGRLKCARTLMTHGADCAEVGCFVEGVDLKRESAFSYALKRGGKLRPLLSKMKCKMDMNMEKHDVDGTGRTISEPETQPDELGIVNDSDDDVHVETDATSDCVGCRRRNMPINESLPDPSESYNVEACHNGGFLSPSVLVEGPLTELESSSEHMRCDNSTMLNNSILLEDELATACFNLVKRHHVTLKSHQRSVLRVIRHRVDELKHLRTSKLNRWCDGDELRDVDKACFEACVTFAQDHFAYLRECQVLLMACELIGQLISADIGKFLRSVKEKEEEEEEGWRRAHAAVEAAEAAMEPQDASPEPQEEWQTVKRRKRRGSDGKNKTSTVAAREPNGRRCSSHIMTLEEYNAKETQGRKKSEDSTISRATSACPGSRRPSWCDRFQEAEAPERNAWGQNESGSVDDKENNIDIDDATYPSLKLVV